MRKGLPHNLTQNGKNPCGISGWKRTGKDMLLDAIRAESTRNLYSLPLSTAHNPEVAGSSPAAATIKRLISCEISRFSC
jgi:hypothetical protein